jgi:hypothetical protein
MSDSVQKENHLKGMLGRYSRLDELGLIRAERSLSSRATNVQGKGEGDGMMKDGRLASLLVQSPFRTSFLSSFTHLSTFSTVA